jgi:hypothetical protein
MTSSRIIKAWLLCLSLTIACIAYFNSLPPESQVVKDKFFLAANKLKGEHIDDSILIDMASITDFPWDTLYVFPSTTTPYVITKVIGITWPDDENVHAYDNLFVFVKNRHLISYALFITSVNKNTPNYLEFTGHFAQGELFTPATAKFKFKWFKFPPQHLDLLPIREQPVYRPNCNCAGLTY